MKIKKIYVDKLPKSCEECILLNVSKQFIHEYCPLIDMELNIYGDCENKRHNKCSLIKIDCNNCDNIFCKENIVEKDCTDNNYENYK
jgi:hypothetical protein